MARLQFRSATQSKGFNPIQLSKASLSEMEKRDAKVLKGLKEQHAAEMQQRETNLQAMRENIEYTDRITKENRQIEVDNLQREQTSLNQIATRDQQQAQYDQQATETIISSIIDFSSTAAKVAAKFKADKLEEDARKVEQTPVTTDQLFTENQYDFDKAIKTNIEGSLQSTTEIAKDGVESSEPKYVTNENQLADKGFNTAQQHKYDQKVFQANYNVRKTQLIKSPEFLGYNRDPILAQKLHNKVISDVRTLMRQSRGITKVNYFSDAIITLNKKNDVNISTATKHKEEDVIAYSVTRYTDLAQGGTTAEITLAKQKMTKLVGYAKTQDFMSDLVKNADSLEQIEAIGNVITDNGELYSKRSKKRFEPDKAAWIDNQNKKVAAEQKQRKINYNEKITNNQDNLLEAARQNFAQFVQLTKQQARDENNGILHSTIVSIIADQLKANENELILLEKKADEGELSMADVNASSYSNRKAAGKLFTGQQSSIYGENEKAITDGLIESARGITGIIGDGPNSVQTNLVHGKLKRDFLTTKTQPGFENPLVAWEEVKRKVEADKENTKGKYFVKVEDNGRVSLPNIEKPDKEAVKKYNSALKIILEQGIGAIDIPFSLDTPQGMDKTYESFTVPGQMKTVSDGIREFSRKFGYSLVESFNMARTASNAALGENKPLIKNTVLEKIRAPDISELIFNKHNNKTQSIRGATQADGNVIFSRRESLGGSPMKPLQDLVLSGEGDFTSANRGIAGDTPGGIPNLDSKTVGDWKNLYRQGYNALGGPQFIENTFLGAVNRLGLSDNTVMSGDVQLKLFNELILGGVKRPKITAYLNGTSNDLQGALEDMSLEFASVANPNTGITSYQGVGGNAASIDSNKMTQVLQQIRNSLIKTQ